MKVNSRLAIGSALVLALMALIAVLAVGLLRPLELRLNDITGLDDLQRQALLLAVLALGSVLAGILLSSGLMQAKLAAANAALSAPASGDAAGSGSAAAAPAPAPAAALPCVADLSLRTEVLVEEALAQLAIMQRQADEAVHLAGVARAAQAEAPVLRAPVFNFALGARSKPRALAPVDADALFPAEAPIEPQCANGLRG